MSELRPDLRAIATLIEPELRLLDIGCGAGELLAWLMQHKQVRARGIEISIDKVNRAIACGVPVIQGDIETDLAFYSDRSFDVVVLSQTLQALRDPKMTLNELLRIGRKAIVSVPNFGHWKNRLYLALRGRMPVTRTLSYEWYDTPNIHFCTISDFVVLCEQMNITIERRIWVNADGVPERFSGRGWSANLFGEQGIFVLSR
jgi:methionine biosynthesis protein MetW